MQPAEWVDEDILSVGMRADERRREQLGQVVTYLRVHVMTDALADRGSVPDAAHELRLYALPPTLDEAVRQIEQARAAAGARRVAAYSFTAIAQSGWGRLGDVLARFAAAGLDDLAEVPVDGIDDLADALDVLRHAGLPATRLTVSHPAEDKSALLSRVRAVLPGHPSIRRFSPLPRVAPLDRPTTGYEDVRMVAVSRLVLGGAGGAGALSIEIDWSLYGPKLAQVALMFGADHLDAVPATSDPARGPRRATVEDVERNIRAAGFEPREFVPAR